MHRTTSALVAVVLCFATITASAELVNFDLSGGIYTKWLYRNNDSQGILNWGNPFWPDNMSGDNGVGSEFELGIKGRVGDHVEAGVRIKSRFGMRWQDWWENGDIKYDAENTSGESLGMNRAAYMKLRGYWVRANLPIPFVESILVGSSDLGMFNAWSIGKVRYIDRDNGKGVFIKGAFHDEYLTYHLAFIALPKLYVGPYWSTGVGDPLIRNPFYSNDWAYGLKLESLPYDGVRLTLVGTLTQDSEVDLTDPDAQGSKYPDCKDELGNAVGGCAKNGAVDTFTRYSNAVVTLEAQVDTFDFASFNLIAGFSYSALDHHFAANGVALNEGVFPLVYPVNFVGGDPSNAVESVDDLFGTFVKFRTEIFELGTDALSLKLEYFNVDQHFTSIFGARREDDVLLTDGFMEGGQLPSMNLANEFVDFDEEWYETIIGWHGGTALLEVHAGMLELSVEGTFLTYNTNSQDRDVDYTYPTFLHSEGFTDTDLYDYANVLDRGRDPRSVFRRNQDRMSAITVLRAELNTGAGKGLVIGAKGKFIWDSDKRSDDTTDDDYLGLITRGKLWFSYPVWDGFKATLGTQLDYWQEDNRKGTLELGYRTDTTTKVKPYLDLRYSFEGLQFRYTLEYLYKHHERGRSDPNLTYHIVRSKAEMSVTW